MLADTHALVWYLTDPGQLSPRAHELFADADRGRTVTIASVTLVELVYIAEKRRDSIDPEVVRDVLETLESRASPIAAVGQFDHLPGADRGQLGVERNLVEVAVDGVDEQQVTAEDSGSAAVAQPASRPAAARAVRNSRRVA